MKITTTFFLTVITVLGFGQNDSISYQYRFTVKDITSSTNAKVIQEPLIDLFRVVPTYQEGLNSFIFESKVDVQKEEIRDLLPYAYNDIIYFKKNEIKVDTLK